MKIFYLKLFLFLYFNNTVFSQCTDSTMVIINQSQQDNDPMAYTTKVVLHFNQAEKQTLSIYYTWLGINWQPANKDTFSFLFDTLIQNHESFIWANNQWQPKIRETYSYVNSTLPDTYSMQYWTGSSWADSLRTVYTYNGSFQLLEKLSQVFIGAQWVDKVRNVSVYNGMGNLVDSTSYNYSNGTISSGRKYLHYTNGTDDTLIIIKNRNANDTTWYNSSYNRISNDILHRIVFREQWIWNNGTQWTNASQTFYSYTGNSFRTDTVINKYWVPATLTWYNSQLTVNQYDLNNQIIFSTGYTWNGYFWLESNRYTYIYNGLLLMQERNEYYNGTDWEFIYYYHSVYDVHGHFIGGNGDSQGSHSDGESNYLFDANGIYIGSNGWHSNPYTGESGSWIKEVYYGVINGSNIFCGPGSTILFVDSCPGSVYLWSTGATTASITVSTTDTFSLQVTYPNGYHTYIAPVFVQAQSPVLFSSTADSILYRCGTNYPTLNFPGNAYTTYQWYKNDSLIPGMTNSLFQELYWYSHPTQGEYLLVATNNCGSDTSGITTIINVGLPNDSISVIGNVPFCNGDSIVLSAMPGYRYQWFPGNDSTQSLVIHTGGYYFLYVTDTTECINSNLVSISSFARPNTPVIYRDGPDIILNDSTNTHWYLNGNSISGNFLNFSPSQSGYYFVEAVNSFGCSSRSDSLYFDIDALFTQAGIDQVICQSDTVFIGGNYTANGGMPPYHYQWSPSLGLSNDTIPNPSCFPDTTRKYFVLVTDSAGNSSVDSILVVVNPSPVPTIMHDSVPACNDGNFMLVVNQPNQFYFEWTRNSVPLFNTIYNQINAALAGIYQVKVTNGLGCSGISSSDTISFFSEVTVPVIEPSGWIPICFGDSMLLHFHPDTTLSYLWYLNDTLIQSPADTLIYVDRNGIYKVIATSNEGCTASATCYVQMDSVLHISVSPPSSVVACPADSIHLFTNFILGYSWQWQLNTTDIAGATNNEYIVSSLGSYRVLVTSPSSCTGLSQPVQANIFPPASGTIVSRNDTLFLESQSVDFPYYTGYWYNAANQNFLGTGKYFVPTINQQLQVQIYNANTGCTTILPVYIFIPCSVAFTNTMPACKYDATGTVSIQPLGSPPFQVLWTGGDTALIRSQLTAGIYTIQVTDNTGCIQTIHDTLQSISSISIDSIEAVVSCSGQCDDTLYAREIGAIGNVNFFWNTGANTAYISGVCSGNYTLTVFDSLGCIAVDSFTYSEPVTLQATSITTNTSCIGCADGYIRLQILSITQPYSISWLPLLGHLSGDTILSLPAGIYQITLTDAGGCSLTFSDTVSDGSVNFQQTAEEDGFYFYPNPFNSVTLLKKPPHSENKDLILVIRDILNRVVAKVEIGSNPTMIYKGNLSAGIYNYSILASETIIYKGILLLQ